MCVNFFRLCFEASRSMDL